MRPSYAPQKKPERSDCTMIPFRSVKILLLLMRHSYRVAVLATQDVRAADNSIASHAGVLAGRGCANIPRLLDMTTDGLI